jgi:hypothetical protein
MLCGHERSPFRFCPAMKADYYPGHGGDLLSGIVLD